MTTARSRRHAELRQSIEELRRQRQPEPKSKAAVILPWLAGGIGVAGVATLLTYVTIGEPETGPVADPKVATTLALADPSASTADSNAERTSETTTAGEQVLEEEAAPASVDEAMPADAPVLTDMPILADGDAQTGPPADETVAGTGAADAGEAERTTAGIDDADDDPDDSVAVAETEPQTETSTVDAGPAASERTTMLSTKMEALREQQDELLDERDTLSRDLETLREELEHARSQRDEYLQTTLKQTRRLDELQAKTQTNDAAATDAERAAADEEFKALREQLAAARLKAENAAGVVNEVARKLNLKLDVDRWDEDASTSVRTALIDKLDRTLSGKSAYDAGKSPLPSAGETPGLIGYHDDIHEARKGILASFESLKPPRKRNPNFTANDVKLEEVHFSSGNQGLSVGGQRKAALVAKLFDKHELYKLKLVGFSDTVGRAQDNLRLSRRRAQSVADALITAGVPRERIEVVASGEKNLPEPTADGVSEPLNRCVAILAVIEPKGRKPQGQEVAENSRR